VADAGSLIAAVRMARGMLAHNISGQ